MSRIGFGINLGKYQNMYKFRLSTRQPVLHRYSAKRNEYRQGFCDYVNAFYND